MKKIISSFLCLSLFISLTYIPVSATNEVTETENIEEFCDDINDMITEYADSEFVTPTFVEEQPAELSEPENEVKYLSRLIVQSNESIDSCNAIDVVSGFKNFYILQFANEQDTNYAYEQYKNNSDIISVEYDISYNAIATTSAETTANETECTYEDYLNAWYLESTGLNIIKEKYKDSDLPEMIVAVVDTGINLNSEYLKDRIIRTGVNNAADGDENSEQDYNGHGTTVSSIIANCTTSNVKIANFRVLDSLGDIQSGVSCCNTLLEAIEFGSSVINCSFNVFRDFAFMSEVVDYAYSKQIAIICAGGNLTGNIEINNAFSLNNSIKTISVGSNDIYNMPSYFSAYGKPIDVLAPGENVPSIELNDTISLNSGTSFSSPMIAGIYAMFQTTHTHIPFEECFRAIENSGDGTDEKLTIDLFGSGIVNPLKLFGLNMVNKPTFSLEEGRYIGKVSLEIFADDGADIYYTTDLTYPTLTNGTKYTEPLEFEDSDLRIRAVAYKNGNRSDCTSVDICSVTRGTDDMFEINENGVITKYTGNVKYLKIPEYIKGIEVKDITNLAGFREAELYGVILPDTLEYIGSTYDLYERNVDKNEQTGPFNDNEYLQFIVGNNIKTIGLLGVANNTYLAYAEFPNCEYIMPRAFRLSGIVIADFPKVKQVGREAFWNAALLQEIHLPECERIAYNAFDNALSLSYIYAPKVNFTNYLENVSYDPIYTAESSEATKKLLLNTQELQKIDFPKLETIGTDFFKESAIREVDLSNVKYIYNLPNAMLSYGCVYGEFYQPVPISLSFPSTLQYCVPATDYKNEYIEYAVYGTQGTYAEQWANENDIPFYEITQETAIREDIDTYWDKYSWQPLEFDARGFNRTYQWYGSYDNVIGNDKIISGATESSFNPNDYKAYPYYYCMMTSSDGDSVVNIHSSLCQNRLYYIYDAEKTSIDYTNLMIFTQTYAQTNIDNIVGIKETTTYYYRPSHIYRKTQYYGTGSTLDVCNDNGVWETYTLIVQGDINGDSVCDVIDAFEVQRASTAHTELTDNYLLAADVDCDGEISVYDYAQVVNMAVSS